MADRPFLAVSFMLLLAAAFSAAASAQPAPDLRDQVRNYRLAHEKDIVGDLVQLLSLPNRASDAADIEGNAQAIQKLLEERGIMVRLLRTPGAPPLVYGQLRIAGASHRVGIYAHYDGQPVDPKEWRNPPFTPVIRDANGQEIDWKSQAHLCPFQQRR